MLAGLLELSVSFNLRILAVNIKCCRPIYDCLLATVLLAKEITLNTLAIFLLGFSIFPCKVKSAHLSV